MIEKRKKEPIAAFLQSVARRLRAMVKEICMDLNDWFILAVKDVLPEAKLVADRFHVPRLCGDGFEGIRKSEMKALKKMLKPEQYACSKARCGCCASTASHRLKKRRTFSPCSFDSSPDLHEAYDLREQLYRIFETKQAKQYAKGAFRSWIGRVKRRSLTCFARFIATLENRLDEVTHYFNRRSSSGWVEGLNNKIKVLKHRCYGLTNFTNSSVVFDLT